MKFWNIKRKDKKCCVDLFGYVGGSKKYEDGFNEQDFLSEFRQIDADDELEVSINSFGGSVYTALSIYAMLKSHKGSITFRVDGTAMSAATIITSVPNAKVIMPKGSMMMIHKVSTMAMGNVDDLRKAADDMEKLENNIIAIYVDKTGKKESEIKAAVDAETYFTAEEAVKFGLADELDESTQVENYIKDGAMYVNGRNFDINEFFSNAPTWFYECKKFQNNLKKEEVVKMTFDEAKQQFAAELEQMRNEARQEGAKQERERIRAIEEIAFGDSELVAKAKYAEPMTAEQFAVAVLKAEKAKKQAMSQARQNDASGLDELGGVGNTGLEPNGEQKAKDEAEMKAFIDAAKMAYNN
jgi:ATP-dependent protease ClpP protease subunit